MARLPLQTFWQAGCEGMIGVSAGGEAIGSTADDPAGEEEARIVLAVLSGEMSIAEAARKEKVWSSRLAGGRRSSSRPAGPRGGSLVAVKPGGASRHMRLSCWPCQRAGRRCRTFRRRSGGAGGSSPVDLDRSVAEMTEEPGGSGAIAEEPAVAEPQQAEAAGADKGTRGACGADASRSPTPRRASLKAARTSCFRSTTTDLPSTEASELGRPQCPRFEFLHLTVQT